MNFKTAFFGTLKQSLSKQNWSSSAHWWNFHPLQLLIFAFVYKTGQLMLFNEVNAEIFTSKMFIFTVRYKSCYNVTISMYIFLFRFTYTRLYINYLAEIYYH